MHRHFTATTFLLDSQQRTLLMWHKRVQRWMPPGGHVDPHELPEEAAIRECKEETGLDVEIIGLPCDDLFEDCPEEGRMLAQPIAMLLENIPASKEREEPAHQHMDFLFVASPLDEDQEIVLAEEEGGEIRWFTRPEVEALDDQSEIFGNVKAYILSIL